MSAVPGAVLRRGLLVLIVLLAAACERAPVFETVPEGSVVLALGDSITHGTGGGGVNYPELLAQRSDWKVVNAGVPGDTAEGALERVENLLESHRPAMVIIELGGNDFLRRRSPQAVKQDLRAIVKSVREADARPVLLAVPALSVLRATVGSLSDAPIYRELAEEEGLLLIDGVLSEVLSDKSLRADRIHPNAAGYRELARGLAEALRATGLLR